MTAKTVSRADRDLFRREMAGVDRRAYAENYAPPQPVRRRPSVAIRQTFVARPVDANLRADQTHAEWLEFCWDDLPAADWRRLQAGQYAPDAKLDLHGRTEAEAARALADFLASAAARGDCCVLIIHGKGLRSGEFGGVLKPFTAHYLKTCEAVRAFCSARPEDGGAGAVYALLRVR